MERISKICRNQIRNKTKRSTNSIPVLFKIVLEVLARTIIQMKEIKGIQRKKNQIYLFADEKIVYISYSKNFTRKHLKMINTFSKISGYKINTEKSVAFLYTSVNQSEKEIRDTISFTIASCVCVCILGKLG